VSLPTATGKTTLIAARSYVDGTEDSDSKRLDLIGIGDYRLESFVIESWKQVHRSRPLFSVARGII
jgi:hypothetical protein